MVRGFLALAVLALGASAAGVETVRGAVAANFAVTAEEIGRRFEEATGHRVAWSAGSTGKLYAQIVQGAPFDLFLAADTARPERLEDEGFAVPGTRSTYARGRLALWTPGRSASVDVLREPSVRVAIANPAVAPYGEAARDVLERLGVWDERSPRWVRGEDVGQTFAFVRAGGVEAGLVALSAVRGVGLTEDEVRTVPASWHRPLDQQVILLKPRPAAEAFLEYLRGPEARKILREAGYDVPSP